VPTTDLHYFHPAWIEPTDETLTADLCVYGGTAAGVVAAVKASQLGLTTVLLHPGKTLGGMTTGGLGWTDFGRKHTIGGMARQVYRDIGQLYGLEEEMQFEPSKAQHVIDELIQSSGADIRFCQYLDGVTTTDGRITTIHLLGGLTVNAEVFIDATYEGDLLAAAGVSFTVGREGVEQYGEQLAGTQVRDMHQFGPAIISPFIKPGDPSSGILPGVEPSDAHHRIGKADHRCQAYNFRVCMTDDPGLKIPWQKPEGYDPLDHELAVRWFSQEDKDTYNNGLKPEWVHEQPYSKAGPPIPSKFDALPNPTANGYVKTDTNNHGPVSSDFIGANYAWATADYMTRELLFQKHVTYQQGFYWTLANDPRVPEIIRTAYGNFGLPKDEFTGTNHWPHQLYVREGRRMVADHVITEHDCTGKVRSEHSVGLGSYTMDSHNCSRFITQTDHGPVVMNEGDVQVPPTDPYPIDYKCIVPKAGECRNLLVPVCISASHISFGSARMEPVFMALAESAACAARLAIKQNKSVQDVPYNDLRPMLEEAGQVLENE